MATKIDLLHLTLCGPSDVQKEMNIAREVIDAWNTQHGDGLGTFIKYQHWKTDAFPDASERGQGVINRQLIDGSDILICIFWSRFGSPTGVADSGTEEEINRGITSGKHVAVYFSDLEPLPVGADASQLRRLEAFRRKMLSLSLSWSFKSRTAFREQFTGHLAKIVHGIRPKLAKVGRKPQGVSSKSVKQNITGGSGNVQIGGGVKNFHHYATPPKLKIIVERPEGCISGEDGKQIHAWIESLAEATTNMARGDAFKHWWSHLKSKFKVAKYELILSDDMPSVHAWYRQQMGILTRKIRNKVPEQWRKARVGSIKAAMSEMRRTNEEYYPELAARLRMPPFASLTELTKTDLERVYLRVLDDRRKMQ